MKSQSRNPLALLIVLSLAGVCSSARAQEAASSAPENPDQKQMQAIEDRWSDALVKRDQYGLENSLSPQFVDISAQGEITTRNQQVARLFVKGESILELSQKVITERTYGETAVVTGTYTLRRKESAGTTTEKGIFTHVFARTRSGWLCLQSQRTAVAEQQSSSKKAVKKSNATEPFHIPIFHKGAEPVTPAATESPAATSSPTPPPASANQP